MFSRRRSTASSRSSCRGSTRRGAVATALAADADGAMASVVVPSGWASGDFAVAPMLAPSSPGLSRVESQMALDPIGAQDRLRRALLGVEADLVIVDCPPSLGLLTV